jgi:hypothetical protein
VPDGLKYVKDYPWKTVEIIPPGRELDVIVAQFLGYEVKPLSKWGDEWFPFMDRATVARGAWMVPDDDAEHEEVYKPGVEGRWSVHVVEEYSADIAYAWRVYERIVDRYDPSATIHRNTVGLWHDYMGAREIITGLNAPHAISLSAKYLWARDVKPIGPVAR